MAREARVASIDMRRLRPDKTVESRIKRVLGKMEEVASVGADIICIPESFSISSIDEQKTIEEIAEDENVPGQVTSKMAEFAKKHNCYVICPVITKKDGKYYNSAILLDRKGDIAGVYHKVHPVSTEITPDVIYKGGGITPGSLKPPVFETDFGKIGIQICFDANWFESWINLRMNGAEIVFFSSMFPGGRILNFHAYKNKYYIVSSSFEDARIIDISGQDIDLSSYQAGYTWASINLEKILVPTYPSTRKISNIFKKYGKKVEIKVNGHKAVGAIGMGIDGMVIESFDSNVKVRDVIKEFKIQTLDDELEESQKIQDKDRV
jgi:predicted amidohydrolase